MDVDFAVDSITGSQIEGWAWLPAQPSIPLLVEMVSDDGDVAIGTTADKFRGDLASAGKRSGWSYFILDVPQTIGSGRYHVRARLGLKTHPLTDFFDHEAPAPAPEAIPAISYHLGDGEGAVGHLDETGPAHFLGWIYKAPFGPVQHIDLIADGRVAGSSPVDRWRNDLEDLNHGDGRVGFEIDISPDLFDGKEHAFDLRWSGTDVSLLRAPITLQTGARPSHPSHADIATTPVPSSSSGPIELSVIVNFYNMHREAERTLVSLSRRFQRDIGSLSYEVICIDNGSSPAMTEASIAKHGPEYRLFRPSMNHRSPVFAINEAARTSRGRTLAIMIDGAHLLSPGVLAEAITAMKSEKRAMVAVRHWFIGGDQRWLSQIGYSRDHEDLPFAKIGWPNCGYDVFKISAPIFDSPNTWFDSMSESNCLFLSASDFQELGGYDERFEMAGGEFANLDLFLRASLLPGMTVVALIGEATFHQFHAGTTTNVADIEKEKRVRRYAASFERLRGRSYEPVDRSRLKFRGGMHHDSAMNTRQRPSGKVRLGLTPAIRELPVARVFEEGAQSYARGAYVETGAYHASVWAGRPTGVAPADLLEIQQMLWNDRPEVLLLKDVVPGLLAFVLSILPAIKLEGMMPVWLTTDDNAPTPPGVRRIVGDLTCPDVRSRLDSEIGSAEGICALFQPRDDEAKAAESLRHCADPVSPGAHLVVLGGAFGQPDIGYSKRWTSNLIDRFVKSDRDFVIDHQLNAHFITTCPSGFLLRLADTSPGQTYDNNLDAVEEFDFA